jgi:hypothetical protein
MYNRVVHPKDQWKLSAMHRWPEYGKRPGHVADYGVEFTSAQDAEKAAARACYLNGIARAHSAQEMHCGVCLAQFGGNSAIKAQRKFRLHVGAARPAPCDCTKQRLDAAVEVTAMNMQHPQV